MALKNKPWSSDAVLSKLATYASVLLDDDQNLETPTIDSDEKQPKFNNKSLTLRQKKKLKKNRQLQAQRELVVKQAIIEPPKTQKKSIRDQLFEELQLSFIVKPDLEVTAADDNSEDSKFVQATYSIDPKVVVFRDLAKKKPKETMIARKQLKVEQESENPNLGQFDDVKFDMKKSRFEVLRFGTSGFEKKMKQEANIALAVKLGAKPPKRSFTNYRDLMENLKKQRIVDEEEEQNSQRKHLIKTKTKSRDGNKVAGFDSQIGRFKNGVQVLKPHDIKKVNNMAKKSGKSFGK